MPDNAIQDARDAVVAAARKATRRVNYVALWDLADAARKATRRVNYMALLDLKRLRDAINTLDALERGGEREG